MPAMAFNKVVTYHGTGLVTSSVEIVSRLGQYIRSISLLPNSGYVMVDEGLVQNKKGSCHVDESAVVAGGSRPAYRGPAQAHCPADEHNSRAAAGHSAAGQADGYRRDGEPSPTSHMSSHVVYA